MDCYVERWKREQQAKAQKEVKKSRKRRTAQKEQVSTTYGVMLNEEGKEDGTDTRSEGQATQKETHAGE